MLGLFIAIIFAVGVSIVVAFMTKQLRGTSNKTLSIVGGLVVFIFISFVSSISTVGVGEVGIKTRFGATVGNPLSPGIAIHVPYIEKINIMDTKIKKLEVEAASASKDLQTVSSKIALNYSVTLAEANTLFQEVGVNYEEIIVAPAIQESVKAATALYTAEELITKRSEVSQKMQENITNKIKDRGLTVTSFNIINFDFSAAFNAAIEAKQVAQQNVLKAEQELAQAKVDAEKKVAQAQADADAKVAAAKAEAEALKLQKQEITADLLKLREIEVQAKLAEKWNGQLPTTIYDSDVPLLNIIGK